MAEEIYHEQQLLKKWNDFALTLMTRVGIHIWHSLCPGKENIFNSVSCIRLEWYNMYSEVSQVLFLWVCVFMKDRAHFHAVTDTTCMEMLRFFFLRSSFFSLWAFPGEKLFRMRSVLPESLSKWNNSIHWCQLCVK